SSPDADNDFYFWDEIINTWINSKANGGAWNDDFDSQFKEGKGYMASYKIAATKSFIGVPGTGTYISGQNDMPAITYTSEQGNGWNLLGNPYPSAINWDSITKSEKINGSVYVRDGANGQYVNWNGLAGSLSDGEIPPGQGFFVKAEATGQSITIENADRLHSNSNFYKDKNGNETENLLSIKVTGNGYTDKTYINFRWDATNGYDIKYDAYKIFGIQEAPQLYSIIGDEMNASINTLAFNANTFDIPLDFRNGSAGTYIITAEGLESFNATTIYLNDLQTGNLQELNKTPVYSFNANPEDDPARFILRFNGVNAVEGPGADAEKSGIKIFNFQKHIFVNSIDGNNLNGMVEVFSIHGNKLFFDNIRNTDSYQKEIQLPQGFYIVRYIGLGEVVSRKVYVR
ncbi:MAG: hypothetical protein B6D64_11640, partial [Bacteroidetes bacterium 4484_276]